MSSNNATTPSAIIAAATSSGSPASIQNTTKPESSPNTKSAIITGINSNITGLGVGEGMGGIGSSSTLLPSTPSTPLNDPLKDQDRLLPIANVARIMKQAVPANAKISKDAKECSQECVSEFIAFITSEAAERCQTEKRKTVNGEDIVWAMETLGFEQYAHLMKIYLQKFKEVMKIEKIGVGLGGNSPTISGRRTSDGGVEMSFAGLDESEYQE